MNDDALRQAIEYWNDPTRRERYFDLYTPDSIWHNLPPDLPPTLEGAREFYRRVWAAAPGAFLTIDELIPRAGAAASAAVTPSSTQARAAKD